MECIENDLEDNPQEAYRVHQAFLERVATNRPLFGTIEVKRYNFDELVIIEGQTYSDLVAYCYTEYHTVIPKLYWEDKVSRFHNPITQDSLSTCIDVLKKDSDKLTEKERELKDYIAEHGLPYKIREDK